MVYAAGGSAKAGKACTDRIRITASKAATVLRMIIFAFLH